MKKRLWLILAALSVLLGCPKSAPAQYTAVTAVVQDSNGNLYANASYSVSFVIPSSATQQPVFTGTTQIISPTVYAGQETDSFGNLSITLPDNNLVTPLGTQWKFSICAHGGLPCFTDTLTITGATEDITSQLQSVAPILGPVVSLGCNLLGIRCANQFAGATPTIQQANAVANLGTTPGVVLDTYLLNAGAFPTLPNNVPILDLRQTQDFITGSSTARDRVAQFFLVSNQGNFTARALTGTVTLSNGSTSVTGSGTAFTTELAGNASGSLIKLTADSSTSWARVASVGSDTTATLAATYTGSGGSGSAVAGVTANPMVVKQTCSGGTVPDGGSGECVGLSVFQNRTAGNRGVYGGNLNLTYGTASTSTSGQAITLELDTTNNSGVDDTAASQTFGLAILSAGANHPNTGIQVSASNSGNRWLRGALIAGWSTGGVLSQGSGSNLVAIPTVGTAIGTPGVGGRDSSDSNWTWFSTVDGTGVFQPSFTSPTGETLGIQGNVTSTETAAPNAHAVDGGVFIASLGASNTQNWTAFPALRGVIAQTVIPTGATGTVTATADILGQTINNGGTITSSYAALFPAPTGTGTITNTYGIVTSPGRGVSVLSDGIVTNGQITSNVPSGTVPFVINSATPIPVATIANHPVTYDCATTTTCSNTQQTGWQVFHDTHALSTGGITITGISPAFASVNYPCSITDITDPSKGPATYCYLASTSSITVAGGNASDVVAINVMGQGTSGGSSGVAGPNVSSAAASVSYNSGVAWTNPTDAEVSDGVYATSTITGGNTDKLQLTGFNFAIPSTATIDGILVGLQRLSTNVSGTAVCWDGNNSLPGNVWLLKAGTESGAGQNGILWPTGAEAYQYYGSSSNLWGGSWLYSDINNANFGVEINANIFGSGSATCKVDSVNVTVYYH